MRPRDMIKDFPKTPEETWLKPSKLLIRDMEYRGRMFEVGGKYLVLSKAGTALLDSHDEAEEWAKQNEI